MLADLRYAVRSLSRAPWYSATVVGVITPGMALFTTVFAVVDGVLVKPLPYPQADRLVAIEPGFNNLPALISVTGETGCGEACGVKCHFAFHRDGTIGKSRPCYGAVTTTALHVRPPLRRYACGTVESK